MSFHRATVKSLDPLQVLDRNANDAPENRWGVFQSEIDSSKLNVGDEVIVEIHNRLVFLRSRIGGTVTHEDDIQQDVSAVGNLLAVGEMRSMTVSWDPPPGGVAHGYYRVQLAQNADSTYTTPTRDFTTTDTLSVVLALNPDTYRVRVRPIATDGTPGAWSEITDVTVRSIISTDIGAGQVNRDAIEQAAIDALRLDEGAVNLKHLVIGSFDNLIPDPSFETGEVRDPDPVNGGGTWAIGTTTPRSGVRYLRYTPNPAQASNALYRPLGDHTSPVGNIAAAQADVFYFEAWSRAAANASRSVDLGVEFRDAGGVLLGSTYGTTVVTTTAWQRVSVVATAPAGTVYAVPVLRANLSGDNATEVRFEDLFMRKRVDGNLIVDGSIAAVHLAADSVVAGKIAAGTITAYDGVISSLQADVITAGTMNAARINGGDINGVSITGVTITGGKFQTAFSGARVEISSTDQRRIRLLGDGGVLAASLESVAGSHGKLSASGNMEIEAYDLDFDAPGGVYSNGSIILTASSHSHGAIPSGTYYTSYELTSTSSLTSSHSTGSNTSYYNGTYTNGMTATTLGDDLFTGVGPNTNNHDHRMAKHKHEVGSHTHAGGSHSHVIGQHRHSFSL